jgi:hypothetical protein
MEALQLIAFAVVVAGLTVQFVTAERMRRRQVELERLVMMLAMAVQDMQKGGGHFQVTVEKTTLH